MVNYITGMRALDTGTDAGGIYGANDNWPGRRVRDVSGEIALLDANDTALVTLLMHTRKKPASDIKFEWFEDQFLAHTLTCSAEDPSYGYAGIEVESGKGSYGRKGDLWLNSVTGEVIYILAVSTDHWDVVRGVGGSDAAPMNTDDDLFYIGNAQDTGDTAREALTTQTVPKYNYAQIYKETIKVTKTAENTRLHGGSERMRLRKKKAEQFKRDMERGFWWGVRDKLVGNTYSQLTNAAYPSRGVFRFIDSGTEHTNASGELTEAEFHGYLETDFRYGNSRKFMFNSMTANTVIDGWGRDKLQLVPTDKTFGIAIRRLISSQGELNLITNKVFADFANTSGVPNYGTCSVILDIEQLKYRHARDTEFHTDIQENDRDAWYDEYLAEVGLEFRLPANHSEIHGWSTG